MFPSDYFAPEYFDASYFPSMQAPEYADDVGGWFAPIYVPYRKDDDDVLALFAVALSRVNV